MNDERQCSGRLSTVFGNCYRPATVERDGRWYCWQHDPGRLGQEQKEIRREQMRAEEIRRDAQWNRDRLERESGIRELSNYELGQIIASGGIRKVLCFDPKNEHLPDCKREYQRARKAAGWNEDRI